MWIILFIFNHLILSRWWSLFKHIFSWRRLRFKLWWNVWRRLLRYFLHRFLAWSSPDNWFLLDLLFFSLFIHLLWSFYIVLCLSIILLSWHYNLLLLIFLLNLSIRSILSSTCYSWTISCHLTFSAFRPILFDLPAPFTSLVFIDGRQVRLTA